MEKDRGLSPVTIEYRCHSVRPFLDRLLSEKRSLDMISAADIDSLLAQKVNEHHYARVSVRGYASSLRAFFRYAEIRGWCTGGIAAIRVHRVDARQSLEAFSLRRAQRGQEADGCSTGGLEQLGCRQPRYTEHSAPLLEKFSNRETSAQIHEGSWECYLSTFPVA